MLGIVSDEEFFAQIPADDASFEVIDRGRGNTKEVPELIRELAAEDAIAGHTARSVAEKYQISESSVAAYKHDSTSTASYHEPVTALQKSNDRVRMEIISTAKSRLVQALEHITSDKLRDAKVRDVASVAKDMSTIVSNMEPQLSPLAGANFVFHVPKARKESDYEVIDVSQ